MAFYEIYFHRPVLLHKLRVQFQGGFVGMDCIVYQKKGQTSIERINDQNNDNGSDGDWEEFDALFVDPIDSNEIQTFFVDIQTDSNQIMKPCTALRIDFGRSTDFYGRIVIYSLEVWGVECSN